MASWRHSARRSLRFRALLAKARYEDETYRTFKECYRAVAHKAGFEAHLAMAAAMP
jgi:adenylate cyclase